jgi:hypothetical protein
MSSPYEPFGSNNPFGPPTSYQATSFPPSGGPEYFPPGPPPTAPLAIMSLVGSIVSLLGSVIFCCCPIAPLAGLVGSLGSIAAGHLALSQIHHSQGRYRGRELALVGLVIGYPALLLSGAITAFFVYALVSDKPNDNPPRVYQPGEEELSQVEQQIVSVSNGDAQGNSPEAIALAKNFSDKMKTLREAFFTEEQKKGISLSDGEFITWCQLQEGKCAFVVHIPSYRKFDDDAKETLETLAWTAAQQAVRGTVAEGNDLAVGMKGILLWGDVKVGKVIAEESEDQGIVDHSDDEELLYPFFIPPSPRDSDEPQIKLPAEETAEKEPTS